MNWQDNMIKACDKVGYKVHTLYSREYILDAIMESMDMGVEEGGDYQYAVDLMQKLTNLDNFEIIKLITAWMISEAELEEECEREYVIKESKKN